MKNENLTASQFLSVLMKIVILVGGLALSAYAYIGAETRAEIKLISSEIDSKVSRSEYEEDRKDTNARLDRIQAMQTQLINMLLSHDKNMKQYEERHGGNR